MYRRAITRSRCGTRNWEIKASRCAWDHPRVPHWILLMNRVFAVAGLSAVLLGGCSRGPAAPSYRVYVSNEASGDLTVIDPVKMEALSTVPLGKRARGIHPSADGKLNYVALSGSPVEPPGGGES